ncbi:MAG: hypothetical protein QGH47_00290, partial [Candidatus Woesearchaeota archaeon]|nr:hypothetical protein [Candidatus Woesearchaeota archaeon]
DIEERHNSLWRHYFDQLFESYGSGKEPKIPITVKPSLTGKVMAAAATVVALSSLWLYRIQTDPDRTEGSHFRSIRNTYAEIKKENREKLGSQLTETKQAYYESKVDYDVIKQKTLALENTIYLSPPDDRGHAQAIGLATLEKFKKVTAGRASYNYPYKREEVLLAIHDIVLHKPNCLKPETDDAGNVFWYGEVPDPEIPRSYPGSGKGNSKLLVPDAIYQSIIQSKGDYDHLRQLFYQVKILEKKLEINEHFVPKPN